MLKRLSACVVLALVALSTTAFAQKNELAGLVGGTYNYSRGSSTGQLFFTKPIGFEVSYARQIATFAKLISVKIEVPFVTSGKVDLKLNSSGDPAKYYRSYFITPGIRATFLPGFFASPWVSAGYGYARFDSSNVLLDGTTNNQQTSRNGSTKQYGGGVDVKILPNLALRGEIRDFRSGVPPLGIPQNESKVHNLFYMGGVVFHF